MDGGYDSGYRACPCFWGRDPGKLVRKLVNEIPEFRGVRALDVGCGEGKNAAFLAACGAAVTAIDISEVAIEHATRLWSDGLHIEWRVEDVRRMAPPKDSYDIVIAYGLLHCLNSKAEVQSTVARLQNCTKPNGYHALAALNVRHQDLKAHPNLKPCLLDHVEYASLYTGWCCLWVEDAELHEIHPDTQIPHTHSLTRILARKPA